MRTTENDTVADAEGGWSKNFASNKVILFVLDPDISRFRGKAPSGALGKDFESLSTEALKKLNKCREVSVFE